MKHPHLVFIELVKSILWDKPLNRELFHDFKDNNWRDIFYLLDKHKIFALAGDKILSLPVELLPPQNQIERIIVYINRTRQLNQAHNSVLHDIYSKYSDMGLASVLLKGLSNSINYPQPHLRTPGDIDIFLHDQSSFEKAKTWALSIGATIKEEAILHIGFYYRNILIENHHILTHFSQKKYNDKLLIETEQAITSKPEYSSINESSIRVLPPTFNAFYLFLHMFRHFLIVGIGIRQMCDWILFFKLHRDRIDDTEFERLIKLFDLQRVYFYFSQVAISFFDADTELFPQIYTERVNNKLSEKILNDIISGGNFGKIREGENQNTARRRNLRLYIASTARVFRFRRLAPSHFDRAIQDWVSQRVKILLKNKSKGSN